MSGIPRFARITRAATLSLVARDFVEAARAVGSGRMRIVLRHLLPNLAPILIVITTLDLGSAVLFTATLSFLGFGAQPPTPEWGAMLNAGREYVRYAPWTMVFPGPRTVPDRDGSEPRWRPAQPWCSIHVSVTAVDLSSAGRTACTADLLIQM